MQKQRPPLPPRKRLSLGGALVLGFNVVSSSRSRRSRLQGFFFRLNIFGGEFERFFFRKTESEDVLFIFGPCSPATIEVAFANKSQRDAKGRISLAEIEHVKPYSGAVLAPPSCYALELHATEGEPWVVAFESTALFFNLVQAIGKASGYMDDCTYLLQPEKRAWTVSGSSDNFSSALSTLSGSTQASRSSWRNSIEDGIVRIEFLKEVTFREDQLGLVLGPNPEAAVVLSVTKGGAGAREGVEPGMLVVAMNNMNAVGMSWDELQARLLEAEKPLKITFAKRSHLSALSPSDALRRRKGPYGNIRTSYEEPRERPDSGSAIALQKILLNGEEGFPRSRPLPPDPGLRSGKWKRSVKSSNSVSSLDDEVQRTASRAASKQLARYKSAQSRLMKAILASEEREVEVEELVRKIVADAKDGESGSVKASTGRRVLKRIQTGKSSQTSSSNVSASKFNLGPRSIRDEVAVSSRLDIDRVNRSFASKGSSLQINRHARYRSSVSTQEIIFFATAPANSCCRFCGGLSSKSSQQEKAFLFMQKDRILKGDTTSVKDLAFDELLDFANRCDAFELFVRTGLLPIIVNALQDRKNPLSIRENAAGLIWNLSDDLNIMEMVIAEGAVPALLELLHAHVDNIETSDIAKEEAAGALWNLSDSMACKLEILRHNGVDIILEQIEEDADVTDFTKENLSGILWNLSFQPACVDAIMQSKAAVEPLQALARLIIRGTIISQENAAGALTQIALRRRYRDRFEAAPDAIPALVQLLAFGTEVSRENACGALHNISFGDDRVQRLIAVEGAIPPLIRLLQHSFPVTLRSRAALCLRTLAQNAENKKEIADTGATEHLIAALRENDSLLQIYVVEALWGLAHDSEANRVFIADAGAIPKIVAILKSGSSKARTRAAGILGTLAESPGNRDIIAKSGALEPLVRMLSGSDRDSKREAAATLSNLSLGPEKTLAKLLKTLKSGAKLGSDANDVQSIRAKLLEIEVGDDDDEEDTREVSGYHLVGQTL